MNLVRWDSRTLSDYNLAKELADRLQSVYKEYNTVLTVNDINDKKGYIVTNKYSPGVVTDNRVTSNINPLIELNGY